MSMIEHAQASTKLVESVVATEPPLDSQQLAARRRGRDGFSR